MALDITVTDELKREGFARELINRIQNLRKSSGFDVTDKINVKVYADGQDAADIADTLKDFGGYVAAQTLARNIEVHPSDERKDAVEVEWGEGKILINVEKTI